GWSGPRVRSWPARLLPLWVSVMLRGDPRSGPPRIVGAPGPCLHQGPRCENPPVIPPARPSRTAVPVTRRALLGAAGALAVLPLASCGPIALGRPEQYTPPPPGIDDLYRVDLLAVLDRAAAGTQTLVALAGPDEDPALSGALSELAGALPVQRTALLTGAEYEKELEAADEPAAEQTSPPPPTAPEDLPALLECLVELRDLAAAAARQVSGSLARPLSGIAAHTAWSALRLHRAAGEAVSEGVPASPTAEEIVPQREVPATDPPSIGAESDYHS